MLIELVVPVYNEEENLGEFVSQVETAFREGLPNASWQILFVEDGSRDGSWAAIRKIQAARANVRAIRLNRNHGSHLAISAGVAHSVGDAVVILAADLQDPPSLIPEFVAKWQQGAKVVWAIRTGRIEAFHRKIYSKVFHTLVKRYALPNYPSSGTGSFCLIDRTIVQNLRRMRENFRTIFGLIAIQGYPAAEVPYTRRDRLHGRSGWTFHRMLRTTIDVFTSYSHLPVRLITFIGLASCGLAVAAIAFQLAHYFISGNALRGWTMMFSAVCFFGGVQTLALGILGEYIWRTFHEVKQRPLWFISDATFDTEKAPQ